MATIIHNKEVARQAAAKIRNASNEAATADVRSTPRSVNLSYISEAVAQHQRFSATLTGSDGQVAEVSGKIDAVASQFNALDAEQARTLTH